MRYKMPVAVHLFLLKKDKLLLLRRFNTGYEDGNYSVVAGHIDGNENYKEAMIREAKEEAGISINDLKPIQVMHRKTETEERIDYFFIASNWDGSVKNMEPDKCDELRWYKLKELPSNIIPYVKHAINMYLEGEYFTDYGWK